MNYESSGAKLTWSQWLAFLLLSLWLALVPMAFAALVSFLNSGPLSYLVQLGMTAPGPILLPHWALGFVGTLATLGAHLLVFAPLYHVTRKPGQAFLHSTAILLIAIALYQALNTLLLLPFSAEGAGSGETTVTLVALLRLALVLPFLLLGLGRVEMRQTGASLKQAWRRVGLRMWFDPSVEWLALGVSAVIVWPWVVFGSLGSVGTTAANLLQALPVALDAEILFRGFAFAWLWRAARSRSGAAIGSLLLFVAAQGGAALPVSSFSMELTEILGIPARFAAAFFLGLLTIELTISAGGSIWPALSVHFLSRWFSLAFVDARSHGERIEMSHLLARGWALAAIAGLGFLLLLGRILGEARQRRREHPSPRHDELATGKARPRWAVLCIAALAWAGVVGLYLTQGAPGFHPDGFLIFLQEQADLESVPAIADPMERRAWVYRTLVDTADRGQTPLRRELDRRGVAYRSHYLINMIEVLGRPGLRHAFANEPGVEAVLFQPGVRPYPQAFGASAFDASGPQGVEWNVREIGADQVWARGYTGQGVVVGDADTGVDWGHPALKFAYAGWDGASADHSRAWYDPWDGSQEPWDDHGHGTHTTGSIVGKDGENQIGVAPGARWIACRNMRHGLGNPGSYLGCMEFLLAPFPQDGDPLRDGDPSRGADVVNNSWGCPLEEGCLPGTLQVAFENLRAAGQMMVVSAGNEGPACGTVQDPPAIYEAAFSVGAVAQDDLAAPFSSRGPVVVDGSQRLKPDLVAPGMEIRSSVPGGYTSMGGTSMAGPHVVGAVALLWSLEPNLAGDVEGTEALLVGAAHPLTVDAACPSGTPEALSVCGCGSDGPGTVPNLVYGWGQVDVWKAAQLLLERQSP